MISVLEEDLRTIAAASLPWHLLRNRRLLITGANGFLPSYMVETALHLNERHNAGIEILALVRDRAKAERRFGGKRIHYIVQDVRDPYTGPRDVDFIVHAASQASPKYLGSDPVGTFEANVFGTRHMLELAHTANAQSLLYFSSGEVYGSIDPARIPTVEHTYGELDPLNVRCSYGEAKRAGESLSICWWKQHGVPVKIVRPFHTYGPGMALDDGRIFADLVADVVARRNLKLNSDGLATRAFCYLADATIAFFKVLLEGENGQAYNVGSPNETSIRNLAGILCGLYPERGLGVEYARRDDASTYIPSTISRSCPDIGRLRALGWEPRTSIADGFARTIRWAERALADQEGKTA
ncbi:MAG: NAD-dependent epimerase/dehydratase family protein [Acidobacteria bacterium]|nr:NAD-dependent epimerase/dehydratase family protein [Acidobacteriota bacterium]